MIRNLAILHLSEKLQKEALFLKKKQGKKEVRR